MVLTKGEEGGPAAATLARGGVVVALMAAVGSDAPSLAPGTGRGIKGRGPMDPKKREVARAMAGVAAGDREPSSRGMAEVASMVAMTRAARKAVAPEEESRPASQGEEAIDDRGGKL